MRRDIRLIMLTGLTAPEVAKACINLDVNAFLTKPAKREMLAERLDSALNMPMTVQPVEYYQQQELPPLTRSQPMASRPTQSAQPVSSAPARKVESTAQTAPAAAPTDSSSAEHGMAYVIWHERFQTGIEPADIIIKEASLKLNETYRARGSSATVQSVDRRVEDWSNFANSRLTAFEAFLAPHHRGKTCCSWRDSGEKCSASCRSCACCFKPRPTRPAMKCSMRCDIGGARPTTRGDGKSSAILSRPAKPVLTKGRAKCSVC